MKHATYVITLLLFLAGCMQNSKTDLQFATAEELLESAPDSAALILATIANELPEDINERKARVILILAKAKSKQGKSFLTIKNFNDAPAYFEAAGDSSALLDMYRLAAEKMLYKSDQDSAVYYLKKALGMSSDHTIPSQSDLYIELSELFARPSLPKNYDKAIDYARQALTTAQTSDEKAYALHNIGLFYSFKNQNDSAVRYMENALGEIEPTNERYTQFALNYANTPNSDVRKSVAYLNSIKEESLGKLITLGFLYLNHSRPDSAQNYHDRSKNLFYQNPSKYSVNTYNNLLLLGQSLSLLKTGTTPNYEGAVANDSITELSAFQRIISEEQQDYNGKLQISLLQQKAQKQLLWNIGLSIVLALAFIFGLYIWHSKRKYMTLKQRLDKVKIEQIVAEASEESYEKEHSDKLIRQRMEICIDQFRALKLQAELDDIEVQYRNTATFPSIKTREQLQKRLIGCFADFIMDLKMTGTKLSIDDIVTCIMASLRESNATIAACLGTTDSAVRTRKSRLRTKLPEMILNMLEL